MNSQSRKSKGRKVQLEAQEKREHSRIQRRKRALRRPFNEGKDQKKIVQEKLPRRLHPEEESERTNIGERARNL